MCHKSDCLACLAPLSSHEDRMAAELVPRKLPGCSGSRDLGERLQDDKVCLIRLMSKEMNLAQLDSSSKPRDKVVRSNENTPMEDKISKIGRCSSQVGCTTEHLKAQVMLNAAEYSDPQRLGSLKLQPMIALLLT